MKKFTYAFLFFTGILLSACNSGKYYFKQRINHSYEDDVMIPSKDNVDSGVRQRVNEMNARDEEVISREVEKTMIETAFVPAEKEQGNFPLEISRPEHKGFNQPVSVREKNNPKSVNIDPGNTFNCREIKGNDKEGFILLAILAGLLIGLGLLAYFFLGTVGLILLIVFSVASGIILVLVLLALVF